MYPQRKRSRNTLYNFFIAVYMNAKKCRSGNVFQGFVRLITIINVITLGFPIKNVELGI